VYSTARFGRIHGQEFAAATFKRRHFQYLEIPLIRWQVTPIQRTDKTGELEEYLVKDKIVTLSKQARARWDLVEAYQGGRLDARGDASILCRYLDVVDDEEERVLLEWSKKHPKLAKILWPAVAQLARQDLYIFIPELISLIKETDDPVELQEELHETLARRYCEFAESRQALGKHLQAVELYTSALEHDADMITALEGRAKAHTSNGNQDLATADLEQARALQ